MLSVCACVRVCAKICAVLNSQTTTPTNTKFGTMTPLDLKLCTSDFGSKGQRPKVIDPIDWIFHPCVLLAISDARPGDLSPDLGIYPQTTWGFTPSLSPDLGI